jgi:glutamine amidotransferase
MTIGVVSYGIGNIGSIRNMLWELALDVVEVTSPRLLLECDRLILPGVGSFDTAVQRLEASGLWGPLDEVARAGKTPILGLCLGAQMLLESSEEGARRGFGWIRGTVKAFDTAAMPRALPVPHMGWATLEVVADEPLLRDRSGDAKFYFAHSFHFAPREVESIAAYATYGYRFPAVIRAGSVSGVQFHPERSRRFGAAVLRSFAEVGTP